MASYYHVDVDHLTSSRIKRLDLTDLAIVAKPNGVISMKSGSYEYNGLSCEGPCQTRARMTRLTFDNHALTQLMGVTIDRKNTMFGHIYINGQMRLDPELPSSVSSGAVELLLCEQQGFDDGALRGSRTMLFGRRHDHARSLIENAKCNADIGFELEEGTQPTHRLSDRVREFNATYKIAYGEEKANYSFMWKGEALKLSHQNDDYASFCIHADSLFGPIPESGSKTFSVAMPESVVKWGVSKLSFTLKKRPQGNYTVRVELRLGEDYCIKIACSDSTKPNAVFAVKSSNGKQTVLDQNLRNLDVEKSKGEALYMYSLGALHLLCRYLDFTTQFSSRLTSLLDSSAQDWLENVPMLS